MQSSCTKAKVFHRSKEKDCQTLREFHGRMKKFPGLVNKLLCVGWVQEESLQNNIKRHKHKYQRIFLINPERAQIRNRRRKQGIGKCKTANRKRNENWKIINNNTHARFCSEIKKESAFIATKAQKWKIRSRQSVKNFSHYTGTLRHNRRRRLPLLRAHSIIPTGVCMYVCVCLSSFAPA